MLRARALSLHLSDVMARAFDAVGVPSTHVVGPQVIQSNMPKLADFQSNSAVSFYRNAVAPSQEQHNRDGSLALKLVDVRTNKFPAVFTDAEDFAKVSRSGATSVMGSAW